MIHIKVKLNNSKNINDIELSTNDKVHSITIPSNASGFGSSANGGEMLFLAIATCYCNDIYREAKKRNIQVESVEVNVKGVFDASPGGAAKNMVYDAVVKANTSTEEIEDLIRHTDTVAEIHNTLREINEVTLDKITAIVTR